MRFSDGLKFYQEARPPGREISANLGRFETLPMEEASLATSVPAIPIAIPMLAYLNAAGLQDNRKLSLITEVKKFIRFFGYFLTFFLKILRLFFFENPSVLGYPLFFKKKNISRL